MPIMCDPVTNDLCILMYINVFYAVFTFVNTCITQ